MAFQVRMDRETSPHRRQFLRRSLNLALGGLLVPYFSTSPRAKAQSKNDRPRLAAIGLGGQGVGVARAAMRHADLVACCDVDRRRAEKFARDGKAAIYDDFRKLLDRSDVDVVTIATPDHWHAAIAIRAMRSGKDVYCEKPLTLTIAESQAVRRTVLETGRVLQVGTQQRSMGLFLKALALVKRGRLGCVSRAICAIGAGPRGGPFAEQSPPPGLNWDFWLGQAPQVPYVAQRCHYNFRWWLEYSGGKLTDWGAHHLDIAQWGLGHELTGPVRIEGQGELPSGKNCYNTATTFGLTLSFADGTAIEVRHGPDAGPWIEPSPLPDSLTCPDLRLALDNGIWFEGSLGRIFVNRKKLAGKPVEDLTPRDDAWLADAVRELYRGRTPGDHMADFFDCLTSRAQPISDVFTQHRSVSSCHLANIALRLGRPLTWDPVREDFIGDTQASALLSRPQRPGYTLREIAG
jgi:predicted dehydrogenase